jgi:chaperone modulatory protein CbpM
MGEKLMTIRYKIEDVAQIISVKREIVLEFIENHWLQPTEELLDQEDLARARLIVELTEDFGVNNEAVPLILHLIDQLHKVHIEIKKRSES